MSESYAEGPTEGSITVIIKLDILITANVKIQRDLLEKAKEQVHFETYMMDIILGMIYYPESKGMALQNHELIREILALRFSVVPTSYTRPHNLKLLHYETASGSTYKTKGELWRKIIQA